MLIPIQAARTAAATTEDTSAKTQSAAPLTASQRGEAIQKILDALTRHLSGREILSKDALVRLMEDLARILKFPPLPQEGGRDFVRRLVAFLESMPTSDRLLLERQLGGRNLSIRVGLLAELPAIRNGTSTPGPATPMPAQARDVILRNPSLQPALPFNPSATRVPIAGEVALLQAVLRKTFGVGNDAVEPQGDDLEQTRPEAPSKGPGEKPAERSEARSGARSASSGDTPIGGAASLLAGEGEIAQAAALAEPMIEADGAVQSAQSGHGEAEAPVEDNAVPLDGHVADEMEAADTTEGEDPDGTYGPLPDTEEEDGHRTAPTAGRNEPEARSARVLSEAIKTLIRDSVALPAGAADGDPGSAAQQTDEAAAQPQTPSKETGTPARAADAAARQRAATDTGTALPSLLDDRSEETAAPQRTPTDIRPQRAADEQTVQQMIARLVENGLPREAIPFTMIPYPPAASETEGEDHSRGLPGGSGEDASGEEQTADEGSDGDPDGGEPSGEAMPEDEAPETPDAYDLYRRLGGLG